MVVAGSFAGVVAAVVAAVAAVAAATGVAVAATVAAVVEVEPFVAAAVESSVVGQPGPGTEPCYLEHLEKGHASSGLA